MWHWSDAVQITGALPTHIPTWHVSVCVHALPSSHGVPFGAGGLMHWPVCGSHTPAMWHGSGAGHTIGSAPTHVPAWQLSDWVQALPSSQTVPSSTGGFEHWPLAGSHVPASWHWSDAVQITGAPATQVPASQTSPFCPPVHASPSLQRVPSAAAGLVHWPVPGSQTPAVWHWSAAVQTTGAPPVHAEP
jgi:hypothetical protein